MTKFPAARIVRWAAALLVTLAGLSVSGCLVSVGAEAVLWAPRIDVGAANDPKDRVDVNAQTDIDKEDLVVNYETWVQVMGFRVAGNTFRSEVTGQSTVQTPFTFDTVPFNPGDTASSDLDFSVIRFNVEIPIPEPVPGVGIWFIVGLDTLDINLKMANQTSSLTGSLDEQIPMLTLGARAAVKVGPLEAYARLQAIESKWVKGIADALSDISRLEGFYFDGELGGRFWFLNGRMALGLGYRFYSMDLEFQTDDALDLVIQGPAITLMGKLP